MYLIVSVDCIGFDHTLFYYFIFSYSAIFAASMSINVQYSVFSIIECRPIIIIAHAPNRRAVNEMTAI